VVEYWQIALIRFMYGLVIALTIPISYIMISEISPKEIRGRAQQLL